MLVPHPMEKPTHPPVLGSDVPEVPVPNQVALQECGVWSRGWWALDQRPAGGTVGLAPPGAG